MKNKAYYSTRLSFTAKGVLSVLEGRDHFDYDRELEKWQNDPDGFKEGFNELVEAKIVVRAKNICAIDL